MRKLGIIFAAAGTVLLGAFGCGIDEAPQVFPQFPETESLLSSRSFQAGDVEVEEQVFRTNSTRSTTYTVRARLTNLGQDIPEARYQLVFERERDNVLGGIEYQPPVVVDEESLGTLHSSQTAVVSLQSEEFGSVRVRVKGQLATPAGIVVPSDDVPIGPES